MFERLSKFAKAHWPLAVLGLFGPLVMWGLALGLAGAGETALNKGRLTAALLLLALTAASWPLSRRLPNGRLWVGVGLSALALAVSVFTVDVSLRRHLGTTRQVSTWNFFHYYLGSKYFAEVGYDGLYIEALKADQQGKQRFREVSRYRDMKTYGMKPSAAVRDEPPREAFTKERWNSFKRDVATIASMESRSFWNEPLRDRGYNPPPGWTLLGGTLCKLLSPGKPLQSGLLMWVDPALMLLAFGISVRTYGLARSAVALAGLGLWIGTHRLFGGKIVQYDWLAAVWIALCCIRAGAWGAAGGLVAYATAVRIFPGALMLGPLAAALWTAVRERKWAPHFTRFFGVGAVTLALLVVVGGLASGRGLGAWREFKEKNEVHQYEHKFNETRIGVPYLSTISADSGISDAVKRRVREANYDSNALLRHLAQLLLVGLVIAAARKSDLHDAMLLSLALIFALAVSSRYYGAMYGLLLLLGAPLAQRGPPEFRGRWVDYACIAMLLVGYWPTLAGADPRSLYVICNFALLGLFLLLLVTYALGRQPGAASNKETERVATA